MVEPDEVVIEILSLMKTLMSGSADLETGVKSLQNMIWERLADYSDEGLIIVLRDLAYDLEYYVANPAVRMGTSSYFGDERAMQEISAALSSFDDAEYATTLGAVSRKA